MVEFATVEASLPPPPPPPDDIATTATRTTASTCTHGNLSEYMTVIQSQVTLMRTIIDDFLGTTERTHKRTQRTQRTTDNR